MADKTTMLYNLRLKCAPMQTPEGDRRYWQADAYGFTDDFATPVVDDINGPYGPPALATSSETTNRYAGSLLGTVARLQGYDYDSEAWRRLATTPNGRQKVFVDGGAVDVTSVGGVVNANVVAVPEPVPQITGAFTVETFTLGTSSDQIASCSSGTSYIRIEVAPGAGNLWVNLSGAAPAVSGVGSLVTPTTPLVIEWPNAPNTNLFAIATSAGTTVNVTTRHN